MTAAVAVMSSTTNTPSAPKRHGFSIDSLLGKPEPSPASPPLAISTRVSPPIATSTPSRPLALRLMPPSLREERNKEDRHKEREREKEREAQRERELREIKERESRDRERQLEMLRERNLVMESMREMRELREREMARERDLRDFRDTIRENQSSNPTLLPGLHRPSPRSSVSPPSPRGDKPLTPESENRLSSNSSNNSSTNNNHINVSSHHWVGEEFKHLLNNFSGHHGQLDSGGLYQPLRVCNRTLASMAAAAAAAGIPGGPGGGHGPGGPLGVGPMGPQFGQLPINPLLYNIPRDLSNPHHPLLAARYPGLVHPRYPKNSAILSSPGPNKLIANQITSPPHTVECSL
ncbi:hypothetical protein PoB_004125000 [Plakobranchus ocellatus]|uniref:Uncharacterized protein n=1 Tax=Plakobranchus ocellatus TaxID=259542 RepID=A0AAV4B6Q4_9GAST|nr:hypothetical protein PoB_004125000 [Plakobranchus ocellatus]